METIINSLFLDIGLEEQVTEFGKIYYFKQERQYSFWLVIEVDDLSQILDNQSNYFISAKETINNEWFDKNANLLILYKSDANFVTEKDRLIEIEENPYLFKKQILIYNSSEQQKLKEALELSRNSIKKFFEDKLVSNTNFEKHKNNLNNNDYESLLYRIAHKIPFLNIKVIQKDGLLALTENNILDINKSGYIELDRIISEIIVDKTSDDIIGLDTEELFMKLQIVINRDENT